MKKTIYAIVSLLTLGMMSCDQFDEAAGAKPVKGVDVVIDLSTAVGGRAAGELIFGDNMVVKFNNYAEGLEYVKTFSGHQCTMENLVPGLYSVNISGKASDSEGTEYILSGSLTSYPIDNPVVEGMPVSIQVDMQGSVKGDLVISEVYYCGSKPVNAFSYFRDQFYEIANNTNEVQYLDGLHFGHTESISFDKTRPIWPESDGGKYIYLDRVWKIPGNGTDYPLQPGESAVIAQFAANHKLEIYNPTSPVDCSTAEFEFNMNNANYPDQPAVDMIHVYYDGSATMTGMQYLTSVFGTGYVIFRIPEGENWNPAVDTSLQAKNAADSWSDIYAKVPLDYVVDVVEGIRNESYVDAKNIPAVLDAGFVTIGDTYRGLSVVRKRDTEAPATGGAILYQDTNNSTEDFECGVVPVLHRYSKMPSWNHSLN